MSDADHDPMLQRAIDELRQVPPLDREAVRRVVDAAAAARLSPADEPVFVERAARGRSIRIWSAIGMAAAAAVVGFVVRGEWRASDGPSSVATTVSANPAALPATPLRSTASNDADSKPILQQFVFSNASATHVSVVGDFNTWNPTSAVMTRSSDGLWSVIIPVAPGRHIYGFMVDSVFTLDPRAPKVRDTDLGTEGSVVIVGRP